MVGFTAFALRYHLIADLVEAYLTLLVGVIVSGVVGGPLSFQIPLFLGDRAVHAEQGDGCCNDGHDQADRYHCAVNRLHVVHIA